MDFKQLLKYDCFRPNTIDAFLKNVIIVQKIKIADKIYFYKIGNRFQNFKHILEDEIFWYNL